MKKIIIGSDHGGYQLKEEMKNFLLSKSFFVSDFGIYKEEPVDYPDIAQLVAEAVAKENNSVGIIVDGAGIGSSIVANKVKGIRAAVCNDIYSARNSREHNDANILTLGGKIIGPGLMQEIVTVWLNTSFGGDRHNRRIDKIVNLENKYLKDVHR